MKPTANDPPKKLNLADVPCSTKKPIYRSPPITSVKINDDNQIESPFAKRSSKIVRSPIKIDAPKLTDSNSTPLKSKLKMSNENVDQENRQSLFNEKALKTIDKKNVGSTQKKVKERKPIVAVDLDQYGNELIAFQPKKTLVRTP